MLFFYLNYFKDHIKAVKTVDVKEKKKKEKERELATNKRIAESAIEFLYEKKNDGYLLLEIDHKVTLQNIFDNIISFIEKRPLLKEEVEYLHKWSKFKDRQFGQSLLAQAEAKKPKDERGKSALASSINTGVMVANVASMAKLHEMREMNETMDEIADDVEDVNEDFGFDE